MKTLATLTLLFFCIGTAFAAPYASSTYTMEMPRVISGSGYAESDNYLLEQVSIGSILRGNKSKSPKYSLTLLKTMRDALGDKPLPPTLNDVESPTYTPTQTLSGTKKPGTAIYINGYIEVDIDDEGKWSCDLGLLRGENNLFITARSRTGRTSDRVRADIIYAVIPDIKITWPPENGLVALGNITIEGTVDGAAFNPEEERELGNFGPTTITVERKDEAGASHTFSVPIFAVHKPEGPEGL